MFVRYMITIILITGEYISLYQSQRKALRLQFQQKDDFINKLLNERADMQVIPLIPFINLQDLLLNNFLQNSDVA